MSFFLIARDCKRSWIATVINIARWWVFFLLLWTLNVTEMLLQNRNIIQLWDILGWEGSSFHWNRVCYVFTRQWVWVCLTICLCLALPDAKVNNQSETTKCAMESGDGNTGEWPPAFLFCFFGSFFLYWPEIYLLIQQVTNSQPKWTFFAAQIREISRLSTFFFFCIIESLKKKKKKTWQLSKILVSSPLCQMKCLPHRAVSLTCAYWISH